MFDPNLEGTWKIKGAAAPYKTYMIDAQGRYFVADPEAPFAFVNGGQGFEWGGLTYTLVLGSANDLAGVWLADDGGEEWHFRVDGSVTVHWSVVEEYFGRYELRNGGTALWYSEFRSVVSTSGNVLPFDPPYTQDQEYLFSLSGNDWTLTDPATGNTVIVYEKV